MSKDLVKTYVTLGEYVYDLVRTKGADSEEFKELTFVYTKDRLREVYKQELEKRKKKDEK